MARLINADDEAKWAREHILDAKERYTIIAFLSNCSTVDAVEVVRCKNCVHWRDTQDWNGDTYKACHLRADVCIFKRSGDDFCSYGERKDNG